MGAPAPAGVSRLPGDGGCPSRAAGPFGPGGSGGGGCGATAVSATLISATAIAGLGGVARGGVGGRVRRQRPESATGSPRARERHGE
ncbi:MAG: hypothetical protein ACRDPT_16205 [Streptomycetales bacterium]